MINSFDRCQSHVTELESEACLNSREVTRPTRCGFRVIRALEGAGLISVVLLRGNSYHFLQPPRKK